MTRDAGRPRAPPPHRGRISNHVPRPATSRERSLICVYKKRLSPTLTSPSIPNAGDRLEYAVTQEGELKNVRGEGHVLCDFNDI